MTTDPKMTIDPNSILFTVPTISNDLATLEPIGVPDSDAFHEDEWCQTEFVPKRQLATVQRMLEQYKPFEAASRTAHGRRQGYVREIDRMAVIPGPDAVAQLEAILARKTGPAPVLLASDRAAGRVEHGFSLPLGGDIMLYGYTTAVGIPVLGALLGDDPDHRKLVEAFMKLNAAAGLILVDWRQQFVREAADADGNIKIWRP